MGIKFYCPQGHKLHVKTFLAGKKGVCPHCGTKVRIPLESQRDQAHDDGSPEPEESDISAESPLNPPVPTVSHPAAPQVPATRSAVVAAVPTPLPPTPVPRPAAPAIGVAASPHTVVQVPMAGATVMPQMSPPPGMAIPSPAAPQMSPTPMMPRAPMGGMSVGAPTADPLAEAPNAEWYICPPTGGRFGPATGEILKRWIGEGRVTSDSLVWRSGWTDWKPASTVLPMWGGPGSSGRPGIGPPAMPTHSPQSLATAPLISTPQGSSTAASSYVARRKSSSSLGVVVVILLGILSVALLVALVWVIRTKA